MKSRIFISSVQREFAKERKALAEYVRKDDSLGFNASQTTPKYHGDALDDALEARLLDALRKESSLDQVELSKVLGVSRATVQRCFKRLLDASKVVRVGGKRFGHWEVVA